ncbi:MAG TPA: hypothetical protein VG847_07165 [Chitinophagaceae bacterium]|nr:hypothetical protein [Chitinophagaceae bacterium]
MTDKKTKELEHFNLRAGFKVLQLSNANYFGNLKESNLKPVVQIASNVFYEELKCVSYNPATHVLNAAVTIKQNGGYNGGSCTRGSVEYVRFYVDYLRNGNWIDEGLVGTNVHDLSFGGNICYNVHLALNPKNLACCDDPAVLPRVWAILSWNSAPPANTPVWTPVWGNVFETNIQIAPAFTIWCLIKKGIQIPVELQKQLNVNLHLAEQIYHPVPPKPDPGPLLTLQELKTNYKDKVEDTRIVLPQVASLSNFSEIASVKDSFTAKAFNWAQLVGDIALLKFNTTYEEIRCVALNRELDTLHASIIVKKPYGYLGDLCHAGSKEYVAFYMDFGAGYVYMGASSVDVHDISTVPGDGLWYNVAIPVNLQPYQKQWCTEGKAVLKAILSWNIAPPANNPDYIAAYGNWAECTVEIKPLPQGVIPGNTTVVLEKLGGMAVEDINVTTGLATTNSAASLGGAKDSPFYGTMEMIGNIFYPVPGMSYRFLITKPGGAEQPLLDTQIITTDTMGVPTDHTLNPDPQGWIPFLQTASTNIVAGLLGRYSATAEGKHVIRIQAKDALNNIYDDPNGAVSITADAQAPDVHIHIDPAIGGDCADFTVGQDITGTYSMTDAHAGSFTISVTPAKGAAVDVDGMGTNSLSYTGGTLPNGGKAGAFVIHTANVPRCGYNVRIDAWDRTIINSHGIGFYNYDVQGFCLRNPGT